MCGASHIKWLLSCHRWWFTNNDTDNDDYIIPNWIVMKWVKVRSSVFSPSSSASFPHSSYSLCRVSCICTYFVRRSHRHMILPYSISQWELAWNVYRAWVFRTERLNWLTIKRSSTSTLSLTLMFAYWIDPSIFHSSSAILDNFL